MSFFGGKSESNQIAAPEYIDEKRALKMIQAKAQIEGFSELFNSLGNSCYHKCLSTKHTDGTLSVAETTCLDRCVVKFFQSMQETATVLQAMEQEQTMQ